MSVDRPPGFELKFRAPVLEARDADDQAAKLEDQAAEAPDLAAGPPTGSAGTAGRWAAGRPVRAP